VVADAQIVVAAVADAQIEAAAVVVAVVHQAVPIVLIVFQITNRVIVLQAIGHVLLLMQAIDRVVLLRQTIDRVLLLMQVIHLVSLKIISMVKVNAVMQDVLVLRQRVFQRARPNLLASFLPNPRHMPMRLNSALPNQGVRALLVAIKPQNLLTKQGLSRVK
jgi:hypothetical protein